MALAAMSLFPAVWQLLILAVVCLALLVGRRLVRGKTPIPDRDSKTTDAEVEFVESNDETINAFRQKLVGTWDLRSYVYKLHGPVTVTQYPHGKHPVGQLTYTSDGHMSVHIMEPGCPLFKGSRPHRGTQEEMAKATYHYQAYAGRYTAGYGANKQVLVKHIVDMALYPNWVRGNQLRIANLNDDDLTLTPDTLHKWKVGCHCLVNLSRAYVRQGIDVEAILIWRRSQSSKEKPAVGENFRDEGFESEESSVIGEKASHKVQFVESDAI